jgi:uncharacterized membrane protein YhiD involved in acid resistance
MDFLFLAETEINAATVLLNLLYVFVLELIIAWVYNHTHRTLSYSHSFVGTIVLMGVIASLIMMVVTENIVGAFALLGAFSLIRFRTIVKETRDIAFVFLALAIGVAVGTSNYVVALIGTVVISLMILAMNKYNLTFRAHGGHILIVNSRSPFNPDQKLPWNELLKSQQTLHIRTLADSVNEYTIGVQLREIENTATVIERLRETEGVIAIELMSGKDTVEY